MKNMILILILLSMVVEKCILVFIHLMKKLYKKMTVEMFYIINKSDEEASEPNLSKSENFS
jgi:type IV secretory pathway VirB3-like protein